MFVTKVYGFEKPNVFKILPVAEDLANLLTGLSSFYDSHDAIVMVSTKGSIHVKTEIAVSSKQGLNRFASFNYHVDEMPALKIAAAVIGASDSNSPFLGRTAEPLSS